MLAWGGPAGSAQDSWSGSERNAEADYKEGQQPPPWALPLIHERLENARPSLLTRSNRQYTTPGRYGLPFCRHSRQMIIMGSRKGPDPNQSPHYSKPELWLFTEGAMDSH